MKLVIIVGFGRICEKLLEFKFSSFSEDNKLLIVTDNKKTIDGVLLCRYSEILETLSSIFKFDDIEQVSLLYTSWKGENNLTDGDLSVQLDNIRRLFQIYESVKSYRLDKVVNLSSFVEFQLNTNHSLASGFPLNYAYAKKYFHNLLKCKTHLDKIVLQNITFSSFINTTSHQINFIGNYLLGKLCVDELHNKDIVVDVTALDTLVDVIFENLIVSIPKSKNTYVGNLYFSDLLSLRRFFHDKLELENADKYLVREVEGKFNEIVKDDKLMIKYNLCKEL
jgi:hypothetical protein